MKFINGVLNFATLNGALACGILFKLGFERIAMVPLAISLLSLALLIYLYLCKIYLLAGLKKRQHNYNK